MLWYWICEMSGSNLSQDTGLPQPLYENSGRVTSLGCDNFLRNPFQFIIHQSFTICHYNVSATESIQKFLESSPSPEANSSSASQEIPCYETWKFISIFTIAFYLSPFWAKLNQVHRFPTQFLRFISILSFHLSPGPPGCLLPSDCRKLYCAFLWSPMCGTCTNHPILLQIIILISGNGYRLQNLLWSVHILTLIWRKFISQVGW